MKRLVFVGLLLCAALFAFSNDFYRVKSATVYARSWARTSENVLCTYKQGDVLSFSEYHNVGYEKWGKVAGTYPAQWVLISGMTPMSREEVSRYLLNKQKVTRQKAVEQQKRKEVRTKQDPFYYVLIFLKVLIAIYSVVFFILLYDEAKDRKKFGTHATYGVCCVILLVWMFFFGKWQWLWIGFFWAGLCYPLAYAEFLERKEPVDVLIVSAAMLLCGITSWLFLRRCDLMMQAIGYLSGGEVAAMVFTNIVISGLFGCGCIADRCPLCHYFCETRVVNTTYDGSSYYNVTRTEQRDRWYDRRVEEDDNNRQIRVTDYYELETTRTSSNYRRDFFTSTYRCPHCHGLYDMQSFSDHLLNRKTRVTYNR